MTFYALLVLLLFLLLAAGVFRLNAAVFYVQIFFWMFGFVGVLSVLYLEISGVYIIEQFRAAHFNGAALVLVLMFYLHLGGVVLGYSFFERKIRNLNLGQFYIIPPLLSSKLVFSVLTCLLLGVAYINLIVSDAPPLLASGYVDRFSYMYSTKLWWLLSPLGLVTVPIPVMLGWLLLEVRRKFLILVMAALYLFYLALIGQKFGGFMLASFLLFMPVVINKSAGLSFYNIFVKVAVLGGVLLFVSLGVVYYHYSKYSLSEEFGGPLGLIAYRIFGLQGHAFWGAFNSFSENPSLYFDPASLYEGMEVVMRLISPAIADEMIERGVSFTFGYFASLLICMNVLAIPVLVLFGFLHTVLAYCSIKYVKTKRAYSYFIMINILILFNAFSSMGSFSYVFNFKFLALLVILMVLAFWNSYVHRFYLKSDG